MSDLEDQQERAEEPLWQALGSCWGQFKLAPPPKLPLTQRPI